MRALEGGEILARKDFARWRDKFGVVEGERRGSNGETRDGKGKTKHVEGWVGDLGLLKTFL